MSNFNQNKAKSKKNAPSSSKPRVRKKPSYKSFRVSKRIKLETDKKLPSSFSLFVRSLKTIGRHWRLFGALLGVYAILILVFVKGLGGGVDLQNTKNDVQTLLEGNIDNIGLSITLFGVLLGSAASASSELASIYQAVLTIIASLAIIWALRRVSAGEKVRMRDCYYKGMYPLVPFLLVLVVIGLQLIPAVLGNTVYGIVTQNSLAVTSLEKFIWALMFGLLALLSIYMIASSIFALYIVTLPDMTPLKALRSARELVRYRRWAVIRKLVLLPIILLVIMGLILIPLIILSPAFAEWIFFGLSIVTFAVVHSYIYGLYRELL